MPRTSATSVHLDGDRHAFHRDLIDDNPDTLTEVRFTETATDQNPVVHLVTDMPQLLPLIESHAGRPVDPFAY